MNPYAVDSVPAFILTLATIVLGVTFVVWFAVFLLNLAMDTSREVGRERAWSVRMEAAFGTVVLLMVATLLAVQYAFYYSPYEFRLP